MREKNEVVRITDVISRFQLVLYELIKLVHVDIHEQLRSEVPERQAFTLLRRVEATHNFYEERLDVFILDVQRQYIKQNLLVNGGEKLSDIALEYPYRARVILTCLVCKLPEAIHRAMRALALSA